MIKNLLTILFYDPDKGWVEETVEETPSVMQFTKSAEEPSTTAR